jgi:hypothetical protein
MLSQCNLIQLELQLHKLHIYHYNEMIEHIVCMKVSTNKIIAATVEAVLQGVLK